MLKIFFAAIAVLGLMLVGTANAQSCSPTLGGGYRCSDGTTMSPTLGGGWRMNNGTTWSPTLGGGYRSSEGESLNPTLGGGWRTNHRDHVVAHSRRRDALQQRHHLLADAWRRIPLRLAGASRQTEAHRITDEKSGVDLRPFAADRDALPDRTPRRDREWPEGCVRARSLDPSRHRPPRQAAADAACVGGGIADRVGLVRSDLSRDLGFRGRIDPGPSRPRARSAARSRRTGPQPPCRRP